MDTQGIKSRLDWADAAIGRCASYDIPVNMLVCDARDLLEALNAKDNVIKGYDWQMRYLISQVQIFILHHKYPETFNLPDLDEAKKLWQKANDYNVRVFEQQ